ncbi:MAG: hypothetical protein NVS1B2_16010 [Vulcanimicrobiaceae bacterium]
MKNSQQTYNDNRLDEISRKLFVTVVEKLQESIETPSITAPLSPEKMQALAAVAEAAACGFKPDEEGSSYE